MSHKQSQKTIYYRHGIFFCGERKIKICSTKRRKIPFGLALDKYGKPTDDGFKAFDGIMLPFGGMKGAAISWMMDIVSGIFTGAAHSGNVKILLKILAVLRM